MSVLRFNSQTMFRDSVILCIFFMYLVTVLFVCVISLSVTYALPTLLCLLMQFTHIWHNVSWFRSIVCLMICRFWLLLRRFSCHNIPISLPVTALGYIRLEGPIHNNWDALESLSLVKLHSSLWFGHICFHRTSNTHKLVSSLSLLLCL